MFTGTIGGFAAVLLQHAQHLSHRDGLEAAAVIVENESRASLGTYQQAIGQYEAWAPLTEATETRKTAIGAPVGAPLIREGDLGQAFSHEVSGDSSVTIKNTDPSAIPLEHGTKHMPPRPFLGPAVLRKTDEIAQVIGEDFIAQLTR